MALLVRLFHFQQCLRAIPRRRIKAIPVEPKQTDGQLPEVVPIGTYRQPARSHEGVGGMFSQRRCVVDLTFHQRK